MNLIQQKQQLEEKYSRMVLEKQTLDNEIANCSTTLNAFGDKVKEASQTLAELEKTEAKCPK